VRVTLRLLVLLGLVWSGGAALAADPAYFEVDGVKAGDALTVRASASDKSDVVGQLSNGDVVQDLGCQDHKSVKWCNVQAVDDAALRGWVEHRYLRQTGVPSNQQSLGDASDQQSTGEAECKIKAHPEVTNCYYVVTTYSGGSATVILAFAGQKRVLEFQNKRFHPQVGDEAVSTEKHGNQFIVSVGHGAEVFHIPQAVVLSGG